MAKDKYKIKNIKKEINGILVEIEHNGEPNWVILDGKLATIENIDRFAQQVIEEKKDLVTADDLYDSLKDLKDTEREVDIK